MRAESRLGAGPYAWGALMVLASVGVALYLSYQQSLHELEDRANIVASEVLARSHAIAKQIEIARNTLRAQPATVPACSGQSIMLMRRLALASSYLQAVGYIEGNRLLCSSYGQHRPGIDVGPPDFTSAIGQDIRTSVRLPYGGDAVFLVSTDAGSGYSAFALPNLALEVMQEHGDYGLGVFGVRSRKIILHRGPWDPTWLASPAKAGNAAISIHGAYVVAVKRSTDYDFAAYAALPLSEMQGEWWRYSLILVPLGLTSGLALAALILLYAQRRLSLRHQLRLALARRDDEIHLEYQPIVDLDSGSWVGVEALLRWRRRDGSMVSPAVFIPLAEQAGLIRDLTARVVERIRREMLPLLQRYPEFHVSVNFSAQDMVDPVATSLIEAVLLDGKLRPGQLIVEVTEGALVDVDRARASITALHAAGIRLSIDDFGTGYCGLSYLTSLAFDYLKIDKIFVDTIGTNAVTSQVVDHIMSIAKTLGLAMIAEGVETQVQADYLRTHGVQYAQGWLYSRAITLDELRERLAEMAMSS